MSDIWTKKQIIAVLHLQCQPSQKEFAEKHMISPAYISDVLSGRREISKRLAEILGFERHTVFIKAGENK